MNATGTTEPASVARATSTASELAVLRKHRQRWLIPLTQVLVLAVFLGAWEWLSRVHFAGAAKPIVDPFLWSRPSKIAARVIEWLADGTIANNVFVTLLEAAAGFVFGTVLGVLIGFVLALSDFWSRVFNPFITALNSIPALVFAPI